METAVKLLKITIVLCISTAIIILLAMVAKPLVIRPIFMGTKLNRYPTSQFDNYTTTAVSSANIFYVQYRDVVGTGRDTGERPLYYKMDLTIETASKETMGKLQANNIAVVNTIRDTLSTIHGADMNNIQGREYIKQQVKRRLNEQYGTIDDIYIEKFIYQ